jgi:LacI family transcriptional regulator
MQQPAGGQEPVTIRDIAKLAKVSPATVSLVMNERPGVSPETKDRVMMIAKLLNYTPNLVARSLVKGRSHHIAMLITNTLNPVFPELAAGVDGVLKEFGYSVSIISTHDDADTEGKEIVKIRARGVDGIITSASLINDENIRVLVASGYPVVSVLRRVYDCDDLDYVIVDNVKGGYLAAEHLIRLGHKRIGVIKGPPNTSTGLERFQGSLKAFGDYGLSVSDALVFQGDYFKPSGYLAAKELLQGPRKNRPTAICACNDDMALGAYEAILDLGLKIPDDVALVGFNNVEATALRMIEITTINQRKHEMGRMAAKRLIDKIEKRRGSKIPFRVVLEPELIVRKSCGYSLASKYVLDGIGPDDHREMTVDERK